MANRNKIIKFCEDYLKVSDFEDDCSNGLQIEGKEEVKKIVVGVTLSKELIEKAVIKKADMIIVHHGLFSSLIGTPPVVKGYVRNRMKMIIENDINLLGFHLPLDAHPIIGNNISLCKLFGIKNLKDFSIGFYGKLDKPMEFNKFSEMIAEKLGSKLDVIQEGPKNVKIVSVLSGGASPHFEEAHELGVDTFICGDIREQIVSGVKECKMNFINAGHYNTEKLGVQNLGKLIAKKFKVEVEFVDIPCDV